MNVLPKIKNCPCCGSFNLIKINDISYENKFKSLFEWTLKKKFTCRNCNEELGLFINNKNKNMQIIWINFLKCEDVHFKILCDLQLAKNKSLMETKKHSDATKKIHEIQNQIRLEQVRLRVKLRIQNKGMSIRHVY